MRQKKKEKKLRERFRMVRHRNQIQQGRISEPVPSWMQVVKDHQSIDPVLMMSRGGRTVAAMNLSDEEFEVWLADEETAYSGVEPEEYNEP